MYEVFDDNLGEWVPASELPSNYDFGTAGNLTTARNIATGNTLTTSFSNLAIPQVMSQIDSTFSQALGGGLANAGMAPTGTDPTKWSAGEWLSDTAGFGSADQWNQLGRSPWGRAYQDWIRARFEARVGAFGYSLLDLSALDHGPLAPRAEALSRVSPLSRAWSVGGAAWESMNRGPLQKLRSWLHTV